MNVGTTPGRSFVEPWNGRSHVADLDGPVHWAEFGEPSDLRPIVFVHGLGGSHLNWAMAAGGLSVDRRSFALDLRGFGMTPGGWWNSTIQWNARLLGRFIDEVVEEPVVLIGNSMGGMVSVLHAHHSPDSVAGLVLVDPALPLPRRRPDLEVAAQFLTYATPVLGELYLRVTRARLSPEQSVRRIFNLCFAEPSRADPVMLSMAEELAAARLAMPGVEVAFMATARSILATLALPSAYWSKMKAIEAPVLLIHGEADRVVSIDSARTAAELNPTWHTVFLTDIGHTPQLEVPDVFVEIVAEWLSTRDSLDR
ncbi:MAG: alpha/beta hydrolase [Candidatus Nanopelagicales bacterium]